MARYPKNKDNDPAEFEDVYAGPGMMDEIGGEEEPVEEEKPADEEGRNAKEFECVYAGPEYFEKEEPKIRIVPDPPKPFEGAYAGPPPMEQFKAVYAGPQFMMAYAGPQMNNGGAFAPVPQPQTETKKKCGSCGAEMPLSAKFCGKCGAKFKESEFCPGCGAKIIEGSKFCHECGTVLK